MEKHDIEDILSQWGIYDESARWSLRSQFIHDHGKASTEEDFIDFLRSRCTPPASLHQNIRGHESS